MGRSQVDFWNASLNSLDLLYENGNLKKRFKKKILYNSLMGCSPFANSRFQMGVTVMGFAEHFGHYRTCYNQY